MDNKTQPLQSNASAVATEGRFSLLAAQHRLAILITGAITIAVAFSAVGLALYGVTGAAQLDLSRPGFEGVSEIVDENAGTYVEYPDSGPINQRTLGEFDQLYSAQLDNMTAADAFSGDPLEPTSLGIGPTNQEQ